MLHASRRFELAPDHLDLGLRQGGTDQGGNLVGCHRIDTILATLMSPTSPRPLSAPLPAPIPDEKQHELGRPTLRLSDEIAGAVGLATHLLQKFP